MGDNLCYDELTAVSKYLNSTKTKQALGVDPDLEFQLTNTTVNTAFYKSGQAMHNSAALLPELVDSGIRLMAYAGDTGK
jgi:cathepsin A (carboxypeptidase C)